MAWLYLSTWGSFLSSFRWRGISLKSALYTDDLLSYCIPLHLLLSSRILPRTPLSTAKHLSVAYTASVRSDECSHCTTMEDTSCNLPSTTWLMLIQTRGHNYRRSERHIHDGAQSIHTTCNVRGRLQKNPTSPVRTSSGKPQPCSTNGKHLPRGKSYFAEGHGVCKLNVRIHRLQIPVFEYEIEHIQTADYTRP